MLTLDGKKPKDMIDLDYHMFKPFLLVQDEFRNTFAKAGIDNSALPYAINHLFNQSEYETASKRGSDDLHRESVDDRRFDSRER